MSLEVSLEINLWAVTVCWLSAGKEVQTNTEFWTNIDWTLKDLICTNPLLRALLLKHSAHPAMKDVVCACVFKCCRYDCQPFALSTCPQQWCVSLCWYPCLQWQIVMVSQHFYLNSKLLPKCYNEFPRRVLQIGNFLKWSLVVWQVCHNMHKNIMHTEPGLN